MKTSGIKYLGAKTKLIPQILAASAHAGDVRSVIDVFTGTTRVGQAFRESGFRVITSDMSAYSADFSRCYLQGTPEDVEIVAPIIARLNELPGICGWITQNYAEAITKGGNVIKYLHPKNASRGDAIRDHIEEISGDISPVQKSILITSLIMALDRVDSSVGIQQAYLKQYASRALNDMQLTVPVIPAGYVGKHFTGDALEIEYPGADMAYLDPPYSAHNYGTYYHIWDSISKWDKPEVGLTTNRRVDRIGDKTPKSMWNGPEALQAFRLLFERLPVEHILVSYSDDSKLIQRNDLLQLCREYGHVQQWEIDYKRNIMSSIGNAHDSANPVTKNHELLFLTSLL